MADDLMREVGRLTAVLVWCFVVGMVLGTVAGLWWKYVAAWLFSWGC